MSDVWVKVTEPWVGKEDIWQNRFNPERFSLDGGKTYYDLEEDLDPEGNPVMHNSEENTSA